MSLKENLEWRYATKQFDPAYSVSESDLAYIESCIQLTASSYGLQPYKVFRIANPELRATLKAASWNQAQITEASEVFVFCSFTKVPDEFVDGVMQAKGKVLNMDDEKVTSYANSMKGKISEKSDDEQASWTAKQAYIALGNALAACAELGLDSCPMEGFEKSEYSRILKLDAQGLEASVVLTVGKRSATDAAADKPKFRREIEDLFEVID